MLKRKSSIFIENGATFSGKVIWNPAVGGIDNYLNIVNFFG